MCHPSHIADSFSGGFLRSFHCQCYGAQVFDAFGPACLWGDVFLARAPHAWWQEEEKHGARKTDMSLIQLIELLPLHMSYDYLTVVVGLTDSCVLKLL